MQGRYTTTDVLLESNLHVRMLLSRLTPNLGKFIGSLQDELGLAMGDELPECGGEHYLL